MSFNDLLSGNKKGIDNPNKTSEAPKKMYKSYYLDDATVQLINKITLTEKIKNPKYSQGDAIRDAFLLLEKKLR